MALEHDDCAVKLVVLDASWKGKSSVARELSKLGDPPGECIRREVVAETCLISAQDVSCLPSPAKVILGDVHVVGQLEHRVRDNNAVVDWLPAEVIAHGHCEEREGDFERDYH